MRKMKWLFDLVPLMLFWAMLSVLVWGWIFTFLTDAPAENKLTVFLDVPAVNSTPLAVLLEEEAGEGIKMVKVNAFTYAMMDAAEISAADVYVVSAAEVETYRDWFRPLPEELAGAEDALLLDGEPWGLRIYDGEARTGAAAGYIQYTAPGEAEEDHYLLFGGASLHVPGNEGAVDGEAVRLVQRLMNIP